ncbi:ZP domain-containing protein-like isoform X2 [Oculina patagonica]
MPDSCVKSGYCGTHSPGWFHGSHPKEVGEVSTGRVCFNFMGSCCEWYMPSKVKKCNGFYVYRLPPTSYCDLQYCGDGTTDLDCAADNNDITVNGSTPGSLSSPNFPRQYPNSLQCTWRITAPAGMRVKLVLRNLTLGPNDYITFRDGVRENSTQIAKYADFASGELRLFSTDRFMLVNFVSNTSEPGIGFQLDYEGVVSEYVEPTTVSPARTTGKTPTTEPDDFAMDVNCDKDEINVVLHIKSVLNHDPESVHLNDPSCKPYFQNNTHIFIKSTLEGCGMAWNISEDGKMIVYRNAITALVRSQNTLGSYATRDHEAVFEFQCRYKRRAVLSVVSFDPSKIFVVTDIESFGNFTFEMHLFKSGDFKEHYTRYPVGPIDVGADIYLQVSVTSSDAGLVVFVDECKATPSTEYHDQMQFIFLEDGCPKDNALRYNYSLSSVQRLTLSAFRFIAVKSKEIFLHCLVKACLRSDRSSRCAEGCKFEKKRKRASEQEIERLLAVGPIIVSSNPPNEESLKPKEGTRILIYIVAGVLGFVVVLLVAALVAFICKPRKKPGETGAATLLVVRKQVPGPG